MELKLIIGNKNYSSWSLRPWLLLKYFEIPFEEIRIPLYLPGSSEKITEYTPVGLVPVLKINKIACWDSLAICETVAEMYPNLHCWPKDKDARVHARSISNEMHSGFFEVRNQMPMNCRQNKQLESIPPELYAEIERLQGIWTDCREKYGNDGCFLFGEFSIADAMYAPVVVRFNNYGIRVSETERLYMDSILALDTMKQWMLAAENEKEVIEGYD